MNPREPVATAGDWISPLVLLDCDLREGGVDIVGDAVVILVHCTIGPKARALGPAGRVFELECRFV